MADTLSHPTLQDGQAALDRAHYDRAVDIGRRLLEAGQLEQAGQLLGSVLEREPDHVLGRALYAEHFLRRDYWREGADNFAAAFSQHATAPALQRLQAFLTDALANVRRGSLQTAVLQRFVDDMGQRTDPATTGEVLATVQSALDRDTSAGLSANQSTASVPAPSRQTASSSRSTPSNSIGPYGKRHGDGPSHTAQSQGATITPTPGPYYTTRTVAVATLLGGPVGGSVPLGLNYMRHREGQKAVLSVLAGVGYMAALIGLTWVLPDGGGLELFGSVVGVVALATPVLVAQKIQKPWVSAQLEAGAKEGSMGAAAFMGMAALFVQGIVLCCGAVGFVDADAEQSETAVLEAEQAASGAQSFSDVANGTHHVCAITSAGNVKCWIKADAGEEGRDLGQADSPDGTFSAVTASALSTCGVRSDGGVECWGLLGDDHNSYTVPDGDYVDVDVGSGHACGLQKSGAVACWGQNRHGQIDAPSKRFKAVAAAEFFSCGIGRDDGQITCWGDDDGGKTDAPEGSFTDIDAHAKRACAVRDDGEILCWGVSMLSVSSNEERPKAQYTQVSAGTLIECGLTDAQKLECWGSPGLVDVIPEGRFQDVSTTFGHACALSTAGELECWGDSPYRDQ